MMIRRNGRAGADGGGDQSRYCGGQFAATGRPLFTLTTRLVRDRNFARLR
jgi:hypothetical protein